MIFGVHEKVRAKFKIRRIFLHKIQNTIKEKMNIDKENAPQQVTADKPQLPVKQKKEVKKVQKEEKKVKKVKDEDKTDWTPALEELLVRLYKKQVVALGKGAPDNGCLKTQSWNKIHEEFTKKSGKNWGKSVLTSKMTQLKTQYVMFRDLK